MAENTHLCGDALVRLRHSANECRSEQNGERDKLKTGSIIHYILIIYNQFRNRLHSQPGPEVRALGTDKPNFSL